MKTPQYHARPEDQTTSQRFEAKYWIDEYLARAIVDYIAPYVTTDRHVEWGEPYVINSLYLDNSELRLYWSSRLGEKNRMKLRIRSYSDRPEDPVFFEIKRRVNQVIMKQRATMTRESVERLLAGQDVPHESFLKPGARERENFYQFRDYVETMGAGPLAMVRYTREAYMSDLEEPVRITFDRELATLACPVYDPSVWTYGPRWSQTDIIPVILELKFTNTFPFWVKKMIQRFQLRQDSFAKYIACVDVLKNEGEMLAWTPNMNEDPLWSAVTVFPLED